MDHSADRARANSSRGITAVGVFLLFGAMMACLAGFTLTWRGTSLDRVWALNARAYRQLAPFGKAAGISFLALGGIFCLTAVGWFRRRFWSWRLTVAIIATQVLGDVINALTGHPVEGAVGVTIAGALLVYLLRDDVRSVFENASRSDPPIQHR